MQCSYVVSCVSRCVNGIHTDDEDDFRSWSGRVEHLILLNEFSRLRQVRVALDGELVDGGEAVIASVRKVGAVGQH